MPGDHKTTQAVFPTFLVVLGVVLILGSLAWLVGGASLLATPTPQADADIPYPKIQRISVKDAKAALDLGTAIFIDTRSASSYSQGHIPGALSITVSELPDRLGELDASAWIITYCT